MYRRGRGAQAYTCATKQLRIEIDEETDAALESLAAFERTPKEALIRRMLVDGVRLVTVHDPLNDLVGRYDAERRDFDLATHDDPLDAIVGSIDAELVTDIDEVIYGR